jgi:hypothetical protein
MYIAIFLGGAGSPSATYVSLEHRSRFRTGTKTSRRSCRNHLGWQLVTASALKHRVFIKFNQIPDYLELGTRERERWFGSANRAQTFDLFSCSQALK